MSVSGLRNREWTEHLVLPGLALTAFAYLYWRFQKIFGCPSCYLFNDSGDGLKNYYTSAYWVRYDPGLWFSGMNYPYGEHPVYTDNQPAWSLLMKTVNLIFPMEQHVVGTINMLMILSLLVGVIAIYLVLRTALLPPWYAALVSLPIIFLSPQIARFIGHYSLAYVCYLPLFLLFCFRWLKNGLRWQGGVGLLIWIAWMGFTHLYFLFIAAAFLMALTLVLFVQQRLRWSRRLGRIILVVVASSVIVYVPVKLTDPVTDRPKEVYGLYTYTATPAGTFLPWHGTWKKVWEDMNLKLPDIEARSYLGIFGILLSPLILFLAIWNLVRRKRREIYVFDEDISPGTLAWAGFLVWIFSTGWFYLIGGSILVDTFPVLGQFRSLGRLAWISYFTYLIFAASWLYHSIKAISTRGIKAAGMALSGALIIFWMTEADDFTYDTTASIFRPNEVFRGDKPYLDVLQRNHLDVEDFQAILQIPLMFVGTENLTVMRGHWEFNKTTQCSWETGLPIINYNMSRTSVGHALSLLQLISTPDIHKTRLDDMNQKPVLLLTYKAQHLPTEQRLVDLAQYLGSVGTMDVYKLSVRTFTEPQDTTGDQFVTVERKNFGPVPFDETTGTEDFRTVSMDEVFFTFRDTFRMSAPLRFSCWVHLDAVTPGFPAIRVVQSAADGALFEEQVHSIHSFDPWQVRGSWVEITFPLVSTQHGAVYAFSTLNKWAKIDAVTISRQAQER